MRSETEVNPEVRRQDIFQRLTRIIRTDKKFSMNLTPEAQLSEDMTLSKDDFTPHDPMCLDWDAFDFHAMAKEIEKEFGIDGLEAFDGMKGNNIRELVDFLVAHATK